MLKKLCGKSVIVGLLASAVLVGSAAANAMVPPQDPASNIAPSQAFFSACVSAANANPGCLAAASSELATDRAAEGVGPLSLPNNFASLSAQEQVFVVTNLERVDRGLPPISGLASALDSLAQQGADDGTDPNFPPYANGGGSNWAGVANLFVADQLEMYDDGLNGPNSDCTSASSFGCWGHRDNILGTYLTPALMGAGWTGGSGGAVTQLFVGGDTADAAYFTWAQVTPQLPVGLSTQSITASTSAGASQSTLVQVWASGEPMAVNASVSGAAGAFSVSPASCNLAAGQACTLSVTFHPSGAGTFSGTLTVSGPNGPRTVALGGTATGASPVTGPTRVMDTRSGLGAAGPVGPGQTVTLNLSGLVPATATAVALNVTGVQPTAGTYISVFPAGQANPGVSNLNLPAGAIEANMVDVMLGTSQSVNFYNAVGSIDIIADLEGSFGPGSTSLFNPLAATRVMDTRSNLGASGPVGPNGTVTLSLAGSVPASATAVMLNVTGVQPTAGTYVSVYPAGAGVPSYSNLNLPPAAITANLVMAILGPGQSVTFYNAAGNINLLADLEGFFGPGAGGSVTVIKAPSRVMDTRSNLGAAGPVGPGQTVTLNLAGSVPANATAVILNLTGVAPTQGTFVTVYPAGQSMPGVSNLNLPAGAITPNLVEVALGSNESITFFNAVGSISLLADLSGYTVPNTG